MTDIVRRGTTARYSDSVSHAGVVHLVEVPASEGTDIRTQTRETLASIERQLAAAGSDKSRILIATIYLVDMADYDGMNEVWDAWVPAGCAPSRACVRVAGLARDGWRVEVALAAALR